MDFSESAEHALLRHTAADIARDFGHVYYAERARSGAKTDELWSAVSERGLLGVHLPEEFGG
ncbi:MAG TPA: acyl-CoA dehydrogenase family protein, partial [Mycobacteriales bacterium]|nr:acyl-CoA dehydrogenase family protein [Mycobacteriales bacterium]